MVHSKGENKFGVVSYTVKNTLIKKIIDSQIFTQDMDKFISTQS